MTAGIWRARLTDGAFAVVTSALALTGFGAVFGGHTYLLLGLAGIAVAVVTAVATVRLPVLLAVALAVVLFVWVGVLLVFPRSTTMTVLPTTGAIRSIGNAAVHGWRDLVTTLPPVVGRDLLTIPYLCGLAGTLTGLLLSWRTKAPMLPLVGPAALLVAVILLGTRTHESPIVNGVAFGIAGLAWAVLRHRRHQPVTVGGGRRSAGRLGMAAVIVVVGLGAGAVALTPLGESQSRYVLREHVQPPYDVSAYPSPLSSFRKFEVAEKNTVLFTVSGLPSGARIQLAVMDSYDGVVWGVAGGRGSTESSGVFQRVGDPIPTAVDGPAATVTVTAGALAGVWMPTVGRIRTIRFSGPRAGALAASFRYNRTIGVGVVPVALSASDTYTMNVVVPPVPAVSSLLDNAIGSATLPDPSGVPDQVSIKAGEWTDGVSQPVARLESIVAKLHSGAFSDGSLDSGVVSPPGAGERRIETFLSARQLVGDGEQYAATLALLARYLGMPSRVVLGVVPQAGFTGQVTGKMISAWVEVDIDGAGWVPFDPTPPVTNKPKPQPTPHQPNVLTRVVAPPVVAAQATEEQPADDGLIGPPPAAGTLDRLLALLLTIGEYGGLPLLLAGGLLGAIAWTKRRRRQRRQTRGTPLARIAAGWLELLDRLRDLGITVPADGTRRQIAEAAVFPQVMALASRVDEAVFAPGEPTGDDARELWAALDAHLARLAETRSRTRRFAGAVNPITLLPAAWRRMARPRAVVREH